MFIKRSRRQRRIGFFNLFRCSMWALNRILYEPIWKWCRFNINEPLTLFHSLVFWEFTSFLQLDCYRPQRSWGKVMFLHVSVILFMRGGIPAYPAACLQWGVVSQHALQVSRPTPRGEVEGSGLVVSRPTPRGLQAHTWGVSRPNPGGSPGPHLEGLQAHTWGGYPSMYWGRPPQTATAAGGKHPTGMHSCFTVRWPHKEGSWILLTQFHVLRPQTDGCWDTVHAWQPFCWRHCRFP